MNYQPSPQSAQEEQNEILETASYARELAQQPQQQMSEPVSSDNQYLDNKMPVVDSTQPL